MNSKINPVFIYILVICAGLALGNYAYNHFNLKEKLTFRKAVSAPAKPKTVPPVSLPVKQIMPPAAVTPEIPAKSAPNPEPTLVLNGVFFEQGQGLALINNKIVRAGDEVDHAKVKEIEITGVELEYEGKTIKLLSPS